MLMPVLSHVNGLAQKHAIQLMSLAYDLAAAELIWQAWATHMSPPEGHPVAEGTRAKDMVMATLT